MEKILSKEIFKMLDENKVLKRRVRFKRKEVNRRKYITVCFCYKRLTLFNNIIKGQILVKPYRRTIKKKKIKHKVTFYNVIK